MVLSSIDSEIVIVNANKSKIGHMILFISRLRPPYLKPEIKSNKGACGLEP